ncbi:hypothetical protein HGO34_21565 [Agrobacterium vitis]|uniref:Uncharacterized protein n=1 Tax=Agrobacterium vitis TaxID=373 RepID=A0AAE4WEW8_AGRVI|nr:hypothetical protein [Agrobacterium vitis]MCF1500010.1 hypothetical protein [Allorhizobium sp. Av2]MCM2442305.1 hypothetical protein [Agrobacterium vitis]MUZ58715.1 hypothetical protein [Agrobacterium vitis]MVA66350.1 hypothetical protein [Agrobacterium vitis]MVA88387.1 hypothetical protein [Agrobacterium vitis]
MNAPPLKQSRQVLGKSCSNPLVHQPRACHALGVLVDGERTYKLYVILSDLYTLEDCPGEAALRRMVLQAFEGWDAAEDYPTGFAILHLAKDGVYILASRWSNANNLRHRAYAVDLSRLGEKPTPLSDPWTIACVWELQLIKKEADAWISAVLSRGEQSLTAEMIQEYANLQFRGAL